MISDLIALISEYLAERKQSDGGWPEATIEEQQALFRIVEMLIQAKYERDADGDLPLYTILVNRTKERHPYWSIPHEPNKKFGEFTTNYFSDRLRVAASNLAIAQDDIRLVSDLFNMWVRDTQEMQ